MSSPSQILRLAEEIMQLQMELDDKLREGFVSISSTRALAGRSFNFSSLTWPAKTKAVTTVDSEQIQETCAIEEDKAKRLWKQELQTWCGMSGAREAQNAKLEFDTALTLALRIASKKRELVSNLKSGK